MEQFLALHFWLQDGLRLSRSEQQENANEWRKYFVQL